MEIALACGAKVIGVNNRNLHTFKLDLDTTERAIKIAKEMGFSWQLQGGYVISAVMLFVCCIDDFCFVTYRLLSSHTMISISILRNTLSSPINNLHAPSPLSTHALLTRTSHTFSTHALFTPLPHSTNTATATMPDIMIAALSGITSADDVDQFRWVIIIYLRCIIYIHIQPHRYLKLYPPSHNLQPLI